MDRRTTVLIPAFKPDGRLSTLCRSLKESGASVLVVDDGSGHEFDDIFDACSEDAAVLRYEVNRGKGGALKYGFSKLTEVFPDTAYVVTADADGQHTLQDIARVADCLAENGGFVIGSRAFCGRVPLRSRFGNSLTRLVFRLASGVSVGDTQTGLRGFGVDLMPILAQIEGNRYEYEMAMLMDLAQKKIPLREVEIKTVYEEGNPTSHFHPILDSLRIYRTIFLHSTGLKFLASSLIAFLIDWSLSLLLTDGFGIVLEAAAVIAWICSSLTNFALNYRFAFRSHKTLPVAFGEYYALAGVVFLIKKMGFQEILVRVLSVPLIIASPICEVLIFVFNYFVQKKLIFRKDMDRSADKKS